MTKQEVTRSPLLGLIVGTALLGAAGALLFTSSETVLRSSFEVALDHHAIQAGTPAKELADAKAPVSGSEDFWLSAMRDGSAPITKTVSVGDQISMNLGGVRRTLEVSTVSDFAPQITQTDTSSGPSHFVLVTARDLKDASLRPVRFVMEIQQGGVPVIAGGRAGRTL
ncbi:hypothetical protein [Hyphomicrobium sp.]|uniref:hypothetical protein n=1 Tax=Hyphomicrobium sp. TaxID=82 RepID=UPI000F9C4411|nr:hypothetical protein [Hyphomicrobium sp.]RUO99460.1 MAG: hypothetical protein EKK30_06060 [Hyphomicrobium sp.]